MWKQTVHLDALDWIRRCDPLFDDPHGIDHNLRPLLDEQDLRYVRKSYVDSRDYPASLESRDHGMRRRLAYGSDDLTRLGEA
jgi:hypothetical protein